LKTEDITGCLALSYAFPSKRKVFLGSSSTCVRTRPEDWQTHGKQRA